MSQSILPPLSTFTAYAKALALARLTFALPVHGDDRDPLHRATSSIVRNRAEGSGESGATAQNRFYRRARGSLREVAASVDLLVARGRSPLTLDEIAGLVRELDRILAALERRR